MKTLLIAFAILIFPANTTVNNIWETLAMVTKVSGMYDPDLGYATEKIIISPDVKALNETEVEVSGYIIPLSGKRAQYHFMLSRYPENMCFFCGAAGPETAMQVFMKDKIKVKYSKEKITVKGILAVGEPDAGNLIYTLKNAITVE